MGDLLEFRPRQKPRRPRPAPGPRRRRATRVFKDRIGFLLLAGLAALWATLHWGPEWMPLRPAAPFGAPALGVAEGQARFGVGPQRIIAFDLCDNGRRLNCVVDGDTFYLGGRKIRLADVNTPELAGNCARESQLAVKATRRFRDLLNTGPIEVRAGDQERDRYGRLLRTVHRNGRSLGSILVAEGLAETWTGRRGDWCA